ncbi:MAG: TadE/TadG family type IV pilus assembly protein [Sporichthyaceae bacterium]
MLPATHRLRRAPDRQRRRSARTTGVPRDAGTSTVELVITMPALLIGVFTIIQIGLWMHAQHAALAAAQDGVRIARSYDGTEADARARTIANLNHLAPTILRSPTVEVTRTADTATVSVRGNATSILGIFALRVHEEARGPVERFIPTGGSAR